MSKAIGVVLTCLLTSFALAQGASTEWQRGTVMAVGTHLYSPGERASDALQYDVSIRVANTIYVALYVPPKGVTSVQYAPGLDFLVLVKDDTLILNSKLSGRTELPVLHKQVLEAESDMDLSKAPNQYFTMKLQHLSEVLDLNKEQRQKIRPILEQETGDVRPLWGNPALSREEKVSRWEKIVAKSDQKIMPLLSGEQINKLREMRRQQKAELKKGVTQQKQKEKEAKLQ